MDTYLSQLPPQQALFLAIAFSDRMPTPYVEAIAEAVARGAVLNGFSKAGETPLTAAVLGGVGSPQAVQKLLDLGADATQIDGNGWSPWAACQSRKSDRVVADEMRQIEAILLSSGIHPEQQPPAPELVHSEHPIWTEEALSENMKSRDAKCPSADTFPAKFSELVQQETNGINCDLDTEDIIKKLMDWDQRYGIEVSDVKSDGLNVKFAELPTAGQDLERFCQEIYDFCPDVIDQGFGCMDDMLEMMKESDIEIDEATHKLIAGVNFEDQNFGLVLLGRSLLADQTLILWWD